MRDFVKTFNSKIRNPKKKDRRKSIDNSRIHIHIYLYTRVSIIARGARNTFVVSLNCGYTRMRVHDEAARKARPREAS